MPTMIREDRPLDAWGFKQKTILTWCKDKIGMGKPVVELTNQPTILFAKRRGNSQKPVEFYDFIERLCPAPRYAYLFSRYRHNEKWTVTATRRRPNESPRQIARARANSKGRHSQPTDHMPTAKEDMQYASAIRTQGDKPNVRTP